MTLHLPDLPSLCGVISVSLISSLRETLLFPDASILHSTILQTSAAMLGLLSCKPVLFSEFSKVGNLWCFTAQPISGSREPPSSLSQSSEYQHGNYANARKGRRFALWGTVLGEVYFPHYRITCLTIPFNDLSIFIAVQLSDSSSCRAFSSSPETPHLPSASVKP